MSDSNQHFTHETSQFLRVPLNRIGPIIGRGGQNREAIEKATQTKIIIDSQTGEVEVRPDENLKDPLMLIKAANMVKAIGRGFNHTQAIKLKEDDYFLDIIRLKPHTQGKSNHARRIKSRIIGKNGRTKNMIEELTSSSLVITGQTIALLGHFNAVDQARTALMKIIRGSKIEAVIRELEDRKKESKQDDPIWKADAEEVSIKEVLEEHEEEEEDVFADYEEED